MWKRLAFRVKVEVWDQVLGRVSQGFVVEHTLCVWILFEFLSFWLLLMLLYIAWRVYHWCVYLGGIRFIVFVTQGREVCLVVSLNKVVLYMICNVWYDICALGCTKSDWVYGICHVLQIHVYLVCQGLTCSEATSGWVMCCVRTLCASRPCTTSSHCSRSHATNGVYICLVASP